jgi:ubiquinone/menaquinone biosynthesis C-methylase UbiE
MQDPYHDEWRNAEHALEYLARADKLPHRTEGEKVLLEQIPQSAGRVLDLGTGSGRLLALVRAARPNAQGVALDFSEPMLAEAKKRFATDKNVTIVKHDLDTPLPDSLGKFDAVVSSLAIHHLTHERKAQLFKEAYQLLNSGGVFCNLDRVLPPTENLHIKYIYAVGRTPETEDKSNKLLDLPTELRFLNEAGFTDVDCYWKWLELALMVGVKP